MTDLLSGCDSTQFRQLGYDIIQGDFGPCLRFDGNWTPEARKNALAYEVTDVSVVPTFGHGINNLDFLAELPTVRSVSVTATKLDNLDGLYMLPNLEALSVTLSKNTRIDFARTPHLKDFFGYYSKELDDVFGLTQLKGLRLERFPYDNLEAISKMRLIYFETSQYPRVITPEGVEGNCDLRSFGLHFARRIKDVSALSRLENLEEVSMSSFRVQTLDWAQDLKRLRWLDLSSIGEIPSLEPLRHCAALESVTFTENCNVLDGKIKWLFELPNFVRTGYMNRPHYDIKCQDMRDLIAPKQKPDYAPRTFWKTRNIVEYSLDS